MAPVTMAEFVGLILAAGAFIVINATPLPTAIDTPTLTGTGLLPTYTGISTPSHSTVSTATGAPHARKGNDSPFPAFDASQYPRLNFTSHHGNLSHHHCEHSNGTVHEIVEIMNKEGEVLHRKNETHGNQCRNDGPHLPHRPVPSGHVKLRRRNGGPSDNNEARRLEQEGYPFADLVSRKIDTDALLHYTAELKRQALSSMLRAEKVKRDKPNDGGPGLAPHERQVITERDVHDEHIPASVRYMDNTPKYAPPPSDHEAYTPASVRYMQQHDTHTPADGNGFAKRSQDENDNSTPRDPFDKSKFPHGLD